MKVWYDGKLVDAFQYLPGGDAKAIPLWFSSSSRWDLENGALVLKQFGRKQTVSPGDWIIRTVTGEWVLALSPEVVREAKGG
ncbi:MAG TPA: hypothetical protein VEI97_09850 [bacterium]|nr:hypothetical protein [bacterium]